MTNIDIKRRPFCYFPFLIHWMLYISWFVILDFMTKLWRFVSNIFLLLDSLLWTRVAGIGEVLVFPCCLTRSQAWVDGGYGGATLVLPSATGLLQGAMGLFWLLTNNANVGALWTSGADSQQNYRNRFISGLKDVLLPSKETGYQFPKRGWPRKLPQPLEQKWWEGN